MDQPDFAAAAADITAAPPILADTPVNDTANMFHDAAESVMQDTRASLRSNMIEAKKIAPDAYAKNKQAGDAVGVPTPLVDDQVKDMATAKAADELQATSPKLAYHFQLPDFAHLAQDDIPTLHGIEQATNAPKPLVNSIMDAPYAALQGFAGLGNKELQTFGLATSLMPMLWDKVTGGTAATDWWFKHAVDPYVNSEPVFELDKNAGFSEKALNAVGSAIGMLAQAISTGGVAEAVPAAASVMQGVKQMVEHGASGMMLPAVSEAMTTMRKIYEATGDINAAIRGGQMSYATTMLGGVVPLSRPGPILSRVGTGLISGAATGEGGRVLMNAALPPDMQSPFDPEQLAIQALMGGVLAVGGPRGNVDKDFHDFARNTYVEHAKAETAARDFQSLTAVAQLSEASKLRERDPDTFHAYLQAVTENGHLDSIYVRAETLIQVLQKAGISREELAQKLPAAEAQINEALHTQGDIRIPVADYATKIAGTDIDKVLLPEAKTSPDGLTYNQVQTFYQEQQVQMQAQVDKLMQEHQVDAAFKESAAKVEQELRAQLDQTNRFTTPVSSVQAKIASLLYTQLAHRLGTTPEIAYTQYPLAIRSEIGQGHALDQTGAAKPPTLGERLKDAWSTMMEEPTSALRPRNYEGGLDMIKRGIEAFKASGQPQAFRSARDNTLDQGMLGSRVKAPTPVVNRLLKNLTPQERGKVTDLIAERIVELMAKLPSAAEMAHVALAGSAKRGWYKESSRALMSVFGYDAPRFAMLLAAMSPQTSVETNLRNALHVWANWEKAGRPTDEAAILKIMGESVEGKKGVGSVLEGWQNNSVRALGNEDVFDLTLGGPKVHSFWMNLLGNTQEVTLDTWMANFALVNQTMFKGTLSTEAVAKNNEPGKGPGYMAYAVRVREAAAKLSQMTGETWTPAEVQETIWSWSKALYEMSAAKNETRTPEQIIKDGALSDELINATPDFSSLLLNDEYASVLKGAGYGEELNKLAADREANQRQPGEDTGDESQAGAVAPSAGRKYELAAARRLTTLRSLNQSDLGTGDSARAVGVSKAERVASDAAGSSATLVGLPQRPMQIGGEWYVPGPYEVAHATADLYMKAAGLPYTPIRTFARIDIERAQRIAEAFEAMKNDPADPATKASYDAMIKETLAQWEAVKATGLKVDFIKLGQPDPYAASPRLGIEDVVKNNHLWVYPTATGYGPNLVNIGLNVNGGGKVDPAAALAHLQHAGVMMHAVHESNTEPTLVAQLQRPLLRDEAHLISLALKQESIAQLANGVGDLHGPQADTWRPFNPDYFLTLNGKTATEEGLTASNNPLLQPVGENVNGHDMVANDVFRIVHDYFGHIKDGVGFRADGEENAWRSHSSMYSDLARRAMTTETRGNNSWVNFGPHGDQNRVASAADTQYAPQKIGLLPEWASEEGRLDPQQYRQTKVQPSDVVEDERGQNFHTAFFDRGDEEGPHVTFAMGKDGNLHVTNLNTADYAVKVAGRDILDWLRSTYDAPILVHEVATDAAGYWSKMEDEGRIANWTHDDFTGKTKSLPQVSLEQNARGQISFGDRISEGATISLLKNADLSTTFHELGHFYLEVLSDIAAKPGAPAAITSDVNTVMDFLGVKDHATWLAMSHEERRASHEKFAKAFESYLFEGKAPSLELSGIFARVRSWMIAVYQHLVNIGTPLTDEVRGVFDRMLASDEQIKQAEAARGMYALFTAKPEGMTDQAWEAYVKGNGEATQDAVSEVQRKSIADMQWLSNAKSEVTRKLQKQADTERKGVKDAVTAEVNAQDVYRAEAELKKGEVLHPETHEPVEGMKGLKLDSELLAKRYPTDMPGRPDLTKLAGMTGKDGLDPDFVAEFYNYKNGDDLVRALADRQPKEDVIQGMVDQRMLERHGEMADPVAIERSAEAAIHNPVRARMIATELKAVSKALLPARGLVKGATEAAEAAIAARRVRDLNPQQHEAAEARAAKATEAALKKADTAAVIASKRAQLLNNRLAKAAMNAMDDVKNGLTYLAKFSKPTVRENISVEFRDQIDALLGRFDLRKSTSPEDAADKRQMTLDKFVEGLSAMKFNLDIPEALLNESTRMHYKDMTVDAFRGLIDSVKSIEHVGRVMQKVQDGAESRLLADAALEAQTQTAGMPQRKSETNRGLSTMAEKWMKLKSSARSGAVSLLKMEQICDWLDNRNPNGIFNRLVFRKIANSQGQRNDLQLKVAKQWQDAIAAIPKDLFTDARRNGIVEMNGAIDALTGKNQRLTWNQKMKLALIRGDASHFAKLLKGEKWDVNAVLKFLDDNVSKDEWDFLHSISKTFAELEPLKHAMLRDIGSTAPKSVAKIPFQTPHGEYPGWYVPISYDPARARDVEMRNARSLDTLFTDNIYTRADTSTGREITRSENYARPMLLSLDTLPSVLKDEIRDITTHKAIMEADRFLRHPLVRDVISNTLSKEHYNLFNGWLLSLANDAAARPSELQWWDNLAHGLRTRTTMVGLGLRLSTMIQHALTAGGESVAEAGPKAMLKGTFNAKTLAAWSALGPEWMTKGIASVIRSDQFEANRDFIFDRSAEMRHRNTEFERDVREQLRDIQLKLADPATGWLKRGILQIQARAYSGIGMLDMASAIPTWMGAYLKGMERIERGGLGMNEQDAVYFADKTVRNAHGGGGVKDMAAVQRGTEAFKLFTMFYTFWNHNVNRIVDTAKLAGTLPSTAVSGDIGKLSSDLGTVVLRSFMYTLGVQAIHHMMHPPKQDDVDSWAVFLAKQMGLAAFSGIPIARDVAAHYFGGKDYNVSPVKALVDAGDALLKDVEGKSHTEAYIKHALTAAGYVTGLPLGQPGATAQFLSDYWNGKQNPQDIAEWWHGISSGKAR